MKIGILTFYRAHNYGAVLQAYALQKYLETQGYEVCIVDYCPNYLRSPYKVFDITSYWKGGLLQSLKTVLSRFFLIPYSLKRYRAFEWFIDNYLNVEHVDLNSRECGLDVFLLGSDQIWNPRLCKGFDEVFFGRFVAGMNKTKISYAASMGAEFLSEDEKEFYQKALADLDAVSVRESSLSRLLQPLTDRPISTVLDPTFLLKKENWSQIAVKPKMKGKYVLVYQVIKNEKILSIARQIARQIQGEVVELVAYLSLSHKTPYQCASPDEFLGCFKYAHCVLSTSFHGTAFSILFNKPFYTLKLNTSADARSVSLLSLLGLKSRLLDADAPIDSLDYEGSDINWDSVSQKMENMKMHSIDFFKERIVPS